MLYLLSKLLLNTAPAFLDHKAWHSRIWRVCRARGARRVQCLGCHSKCRNGLSALSGRLAICSADSVPLGCKALVVCATQRICPPMCGHGTVMGAICTASEMINECTGSIEGAMGTVYGAPQHAEEPSVRVASALCDQRRRKRQITLKVQKRIQMANESKRLQVPQRGAAITTV